MIVYFTKTKNQTMLKIMLFRDIYVRKKFSKNKCIIWPKIWRVIHSKRLAGLQMGDSFESISNYLAFMTGGGFIVDDYITVLHSDVLRIVLLILKLYFKKFSTCICDI